MSGASTPPRAPKLRASCDACGASKLKCDRGQPTCRRCAYHGFTCRYGVSLKTGRPKRSTLAQAAAPGIPTSDVPDDDTDPAASTAQHDLLALAQPASASWSDRSRDWDFPSMELDAPTLLDFPFPDPGSTIPSAAHADYGWSQPANMSTTQLPHDPSLLWDANSLDPSALMPSMPEQLARDSISTLRAGGLLSTVLDNEEHACVDESIRILASLSKPQHSLSSSATTTPIPESSLPLAQHTSSPGSARAISLDQVLRTSRDAIDAFVPLLACPCAHSPTLALVHTSTILRILRWFRQAIIATGPSVPDAHVMHLRDADPGTAASSASSHHPHGSGQSSSGGGGNPNNPLFHADDANIEAALRMQLLLGEMRKVGRIVEQLAAVHQASEAAFHEDGAARQVRSVRHGLAAWVQSEHAAVMKLIRKKLMDLNV